MKLQRPKLGTCRRYGIHSESEADTDMDQRYTDDKVIRKIISPPPLLQKLDKDELYLDTVKNS